MTLKNRYLDSDHPLYEKHQIYIKTLMEEIPFQPRFEEAITEARDISNLDYDSFLVLYPEGQSDIIDAIIDHIIIKTENYFENNKEDLSGVKKILHHLIMYQIQLYPQMNVIFNKIFPNLLLSMKFVRFGESFYKIIDHLWQKAGDKATDYNYYSKRILLGNIYIETLCYSLQDNSKEFSETAEYLTRAFDKIKIFEQIKKKLPNFEAIEEKVISFFGKMRYKSSNIKL